MDDARPSSTIYPVRDPDRTLDLARTRSEANRLATSLIAKRKDFRVRHVKVDSQGLGRLDAWEFEIDETNHPSKHEL